MFSVMQELELPLFLYGTLQCPAVLCSVITGATTQSTSPRSSFGECDRPLPAGGPKRFICDASLHGFKRIAVSAAGYPAVIRDPAEKVSGTLVYLDNFSADIGNLDMYEDVGSLYCREVHDVYVPNKVEPVRAYVYIWSGKKEALEDRPWTWADFENSNSFDEFFSRQK